MKKFLKNELQQVFAIISPYGTGKTTFIRDIIAENKNNLKRILFITHRRSLASDIESNFKEVGFVNYLNKSEFDASDDRVIVNMDSLRCLYKYQNFFSTQTLLQSYDLIILDEFASLLNNFESSLMNDSRNEIHDIFNRLITDTKKVVAMDGDFSNREYTYLCNVVGKEKIIIYQNLFKPDPYHFIFTKNQGSFLDDIENDLKNKKNIAFVSMSSNFALEVKKYFVNKGYANKIFCVTGDSDNDIKQKLMKDPYKMFVDDDIKLFIYSPVLGAGINFDFPYFYKQYAYMTNGSVNARDFNQMLFRIRQFENKNINILLNQTISTKKSVNFYDYEEVVITLSTNLQKNINNLNIFETLRMHNYWEDINSKNYLLQVFISFINNKKHTYEIQEIDGDKKTKKIKTGDLKNEIITEIVNADNITPNQLSILIKKQSINGININDKHAINKYLYMKKFNIEPENMTVDLLKKIYNKSYVVDNYNKLIKKKVVIDKHKIDDDKDKDLSVEIRNLKKDKIIEIINTLGFKITKDGPTNIVLTTKKFDNRKIKLQNIITSEFKLLFKLKRSDIIDYRDV
jgi:hypothetical protein